MSDITIFVGDVSEDLRLAAQHADAQARLITESNWQNLSAGTYYASLGDFSSLKVFVDTLEQADTLIYSPPAQWSDSRQDHSYMKIWTEFYLLYFKNRKHVVMNYNKILPQQESVDRLALSDHRKSNDPQLWIAGCSISHGTGINSDQRYGQLLSKEFDLPVSFLTAEASSIVWAADQILRSDIRANDIVVWGLTTFNRFPFYHEGRVEHVYTSYYDRYPEFNQIVNVDRLDDDNSIYQNLIHIHAVINFCRKIQARLYIFGLLVDYQDVKWVANLSEYLHLSGRFGVDANNMYLDFGTDGRHPGPQMHQWYFEQMKDWIKLR